MKWIWPLLDPALWLLLLLVWAAWRPWRRPRGALRERLVALAPLALFAALAVPPLPELGLRALTQPLAAHPAPLNAAQHLVVLGGGMSSRGELSSSSYERVAGGVAMWRRHVAQQLVFSGVEAGAMAELALVMGVPGSAILREDRSLSTHENAQACARLLRAEVAAGRAQPMANGLPKIALATSAEHLRRAVASFERAGFTVVPAPAPLPLIPAPPSPMPSFRRAAAAAGALYEGAALLSYWLRGWI